MTSRQIDFELKRQLNDELVASARRFSENIQANSLEDAASYIAVLADRVELLHEALRPR